MSKFYFKSLKLQMILSFRMNNNTINKYEYIENHGVQYKIQLIFK